MSEKYILDENGTVVPASLFEWAEWFNDVGRRRIGRDIKGDVEVSTVFLGIDHGYGGGPPLLFETMIFGGAHDQEQWRYSTRDEAIEGHRQACKLAFGADEEPT